MKTNDIRQLFFNFFAAHGHEVVASSPLVPANDDTLLFTNAGMVQFKDVFLGQDRRAYQRAVTAQRCVRAGGKHNDLENVGYTARHHTFFEMLGNFSFGDYFKADAIRFAWQFLTEEIGLPAEKLWITVFQDDDEAATIWNTQIGVPLDRIVRKDEKDNFWQMGDTGPCGPCSEIFYDHGPEVDGGPPGSADEDGDRYIEVWNLVFMQFDRSEDGTLTPLPKPSVDTGMGIERLAAVLQGVHSNFEIDTFQALIKAVQRETGNDDDGNFSHRVIADHIRSTAFMIVDGVQPSNEGRGYVLRRIIRRAVRHGYRLGQQRPFFYRLVDPLVAEMGDAYPELRRKVDEVKRELQNEEVRFAETLEHGMKLLDQALKGGQQHIDGETAFRLYDTYGFPLDLTCDIARERGLVVDVDGFNSAMEQQKSRARAANSFRAGQSLNISGVAATEFVGYTRLDAPSRVLAIIVDGDRVELLDQGGEGLVVLERSPFYAESGGQIGDTGRLHANEMEAVVEAVRKAPGKVWAHQVSVTRGTLRVGEAVEGEVTGDRRQRIAANHSATHLLHSALRRVVGEHVHQKGSLVADDRLRFDFSHSQSLHSDELRVIENLVNLDVRANYAVETREMPLDDAREAGAMALFDEKYDDYVRVVQMGPNSLELCGGTHVGQTGDIGYVKLIEETGVAAGVRRIEALSGERASAWVGEQLGELQRIADTLKVGRSDVVRRAIDINGRVRELEREVADLRIKASRAVATPTETLANGINIVCRRADGLDGKALRQLADEEMQRLGDGVVVLGSVVGDKAAVVASVSQSLIDRLKAGELVAIASEAMGGRGGGRADFAQGGSSDPSQLDAALARVAERVATA
ncbi:alanine--tRNA ligase [Gammaproteobacteria bacterium]|nr:alanine--tRNA ligase [Gammaproteobacteria bacterium]